MPSFIPWLRCLTLPTHLSPFQSCRWLGTFNTAAEAAMAYDAAAIIKKGAKKARTNFCYRDMGTKAIEGSKEKEKVRTELLSKKVQVSNLPLSSPLSGIQLV
jgi:hypothetical protein